MYYINDCKDDQLSYVESMTHAPALDAEELTAEMRETIERAAEVISVNLRGVFVYSAAGADDIDAFVLSTPKGFVLVVSSAAAKLDAETLVVIFAEEDQNAARFGPETEVDVPASYARAKKLEQDAGESLAV